jgi:hypothetical protein
MSKASKGNDGQTTDGPSNSCAHSRMHLADVLPQVILPHWPRLGTAKPAASNMAAEWMIEDMAAVDAHSLGDNTLLHEERGDVQRAIDVFEIVVGGAMGERWMGRGGYILLGC